MSTARQIQDHYLTEAAYLEGEKTAVERHEYVDGQTYLMAGASKRHNRIARNFINRMEDAANRKGCEVFFSDVKVRVAKYKTYYYPDVVVSCSADDEADEYYLEKPCLIVEVASDSTIRKDYMEKSLVYQSIAALQAYLVVAQDRVQVDMLVRLEDGSWGLKKFDRLDDEIELPCLGIVLSVEAVYAGVAVLGE